MLGRSYPLPKDMQSRGSARERIRRGLAIAMLVSLCDTGVPPPACTWCSSPWVNLEAVGITGKAAVDPLIQKSNLMELAA